jgi:L-ascorbate metabolism protein UlaG (beta-lactamase superfamily)
MHVEWYGQSAFRLKGRDKTVFIDPFGDMSGLASRGITWEYPPIESVEADLVLVTHEHGDHNVVEAIGGEPAILRSTAGTHESPVGTVIGVASEHDDVAGTQRGPNTIFLFDLDGVRVAHFGDLGQTALREEQLAAIGSADLVFIPVGGGPTIGGTLAAQIASQLGAKWVVPMHYRTERISFLEPVDEFERAFANVARLESPSFELDELPDELPLAVIPAAP